jgi:hypothetical protein
VPILIGPPVNDGMARPQVAGGGDGLQMRMEAANRSMSNSRGHATKGGHTGWGLGGGAVNSP